MVVVVVVAVALPLDVDFDAFHTDFLPFLTQVYFTPFTVRDDPAGAHEVPGVGVFAAFTEPATPPSKRTAVIGRTMRRFI